MSIVFKDAFSTILFPSLPTTLRDETDDMIKISKIE